jgi:hypothetical protein
MPMDRSVRPIECAKIGLLHFSNRYYKVSSFDMNVLKRPVLNNIGRFVFQQFKNISDGDVCCVFIGIEIVILPF